MEPALPGNSRRRHYGVDLLGGGVLVISPRSASEAGANATLGKFASGYTGLTLTNTTIQYPHGVPYQNGERCAKGTPDAGKVGRCGHGGGSCPPTRGANGQRPSRLAASTPCSRAASASPTARSSPLSSAPTMRPSRTLPSSSVLAADRDPGRERTGRHHHDDERRATSTTVPTYVDVDLTSASSTSTTKPARRRRPPPNLDNLHDQVAMTG